MNMEINPPVTRTPRHITDADFEALRRQDISSELASLVGAHCDECETCRTRMDEALGLRSSAAAFMAVFSMEDELKRPAERRWVGRALAAAIMLLALLAGVSIIRPVRRDPAAVPLTPRSSTPATTPSVKASPAPVPLRPEWSTLLARVRSTGALPVPEDILELSRQDSFRGGDSQARIHRVSPAATAVEETRPEFRWPEFANARYTVTLLRSDTEIERSSVLASSRWTPRRPLRRGATYRWEVLVERPEGPVTLPQPPLPPAIFKVLDATTMAELNAAREAHPDDHLLLGILFSRAGVVDSARRELEAWRNASGDPLALQLLAQLPASS